MYAINRGLFSLAVALITLGIMQNRSDAAPLTPGDLVISEVMANPSAVADSEGEWFELYNTTGSPIDLNGLILSDNGSDSHTISVPTTLMIASGGYLVLGRNDDYDLNGGYVPDYVYSDFSLANNDDEIIIKEGTTTIARLDYTSVFGFVVAGKSRELSDVGIYPYEEDPFLMRETDFVEATSPFGAGDLGTPGMAVIPEPSTGLLVGFGLVGLGVVGRRHGLR